METELSLLVARPESAPAERRRAAELALESRNAAVRAAAGGRDLATARAFSSTAEYVADVARRTVCLTLLAGAGSRWTASLAAARGRGEGPDFDPARPRGLYPVRDFLGASGDRGRIPIAAYAVAATRGLGRNLIVVRGWEREIDEEILGPLGIGPADRSFFEQEAPYGKPLGHGDAAWQCRSLWAGADYVVANFGGDANSRRTILSSLLALDALRAAGHEVDLLIPAARVPSPAYPIALGRDGLPRGFGHAKLQGGATRCEDGMGFTNVGVRVYRASALLGQATRFRALHWVDGSGYAIPGNDPAGREFALDNADAALAEAGRARILAIARPQELTPVKTVDDVPAFERAVEDVVAEDSLL